MFTVCVIVIFMDTPLLPKIMELDAALEVIREFEVSLAWQGEPRPNPLEIPTRNGLPIGHIAFSKVDFAQIARDAPTPEPR